VSEYLNEALVSEYLNAAAAAANAAAAVTTTNNAAAANKAAAATNKAAAATNEAAAATNEIATDDKMNMLLIENYYPPFLVDNKLLILSVCLVVYVSRSGVIKWFYDNKHILTLISKDEYTTNNKYYTYEYFTYEHDEKYNWPNSFKKGKLSHIANDDKKINEFIKDFCKIVSNSDIVPYGESNSGFLSITLNINFINKNGNYILNLYDLYKYYYVHYYNDKYKIKNYDSEKYYLWLQNCIIYPHFGLPTNENKTYMPIYIKLSPYAIVYDNLNINILKQLSLVFNTNRTKVNIIMNNETIGHITLQEINSEMVVKLKNITSTNITNEILVNVLFVLMDIIAAYYAPNIVYLMMKEDVAAAAKKLQFLKEGAYYIKKCNSEILFNSKFHIQSKPLKENVRELKSIKSRQLTYRLSGNCQHYQYLRNRLNKLGWQEIHADNYVDYVDLAYLFTHRAGVIDNFSNDQKTQFEYTKANLKSSITNIYSLGSKENLAKYLINSGSKHAPMTKDIKHYEYKDGNIVIVREIFSSRQRGVNIITNKHDFLKLKNKIKNKKAIVSTYIKNPLLYEGKKFHLRVLVTIFIENINGEIKSSISHLKDTMKIFTAKKPYIIKEKKDYLDPEITISGGRHTNHIFVYWPGKMDIEKSFLEKCNQSIDDAVQSIPLNTVGLYAEQKAGFYTYGADIMLDDTGHAWILELNIRPSAFVKPEQEALEKANLEDDNNLTKNLADDYLKRLYDYHLDHIIIPYFK
jgi:hypothetical protein